MHQALSTDIRRQTTGIMVGFRVSDLYRAPDVNPINQKARAIPLFNPLDPYGRVFFFSWFGFMIAFWAWYAFPPLVSSSVSCSTDCCCAY